MAHTHKEPNYLGVFWWLLGLTIVELIVIFLPMARLMIGILLVGLALSKASLVAMYFMHLRFERRTLALIAATPLMLCILLVFALLPDLSATPHQTAVTARPAEPPQ